MRTVLLFLVLISLSQNLLASGKCRQQHLDAGAKMSAQKVSSFLDCLTEEPHLSRLAAQWIVLKKAHWQLVESKSYKWKHKNADNPYSPKQFHELSYAFSKQKNNFNNQKKVLNVLQEDIFPKALDGFSRGSEANKTSWSFAASVYQMTAFMDTPLRGEVYGNLWKNSKKEGLGNYYAGSLIESQSFADGWYSNIQKLFSVLQFTKAKHWLDLRDKYKQFDDRSCQNTRCYYRQERKVAQALFATLEHPDLIEAIHEKTHPGFGPQKGEHAGAQESLVPRFGCYESIPFRQFTGYVNFQREFGNPDHKKENFGKYGVSGLLGRPLYIEAINKEDIKLKDIPAMFQGQNAIIRSITPAAIQHLIELGGTGSKNMKGVVPDVHNEEKWREIRAKDTELDEIVATKLTGASYIVAMYMRLKYLLKSKGSLSAQEMTLYEEFKYIINNGPFFKETIVSYGLSLGTWIKKLSQWNPPVAYYLFAYDYGLSSRRSEEFNSYYDRMVFVLKSEDYFAKYEH